MDIAIGAWLLVALGVVVAFTGTRLFWLAVGIAGFAFGWLVTLTLFPNVDPLAGLLIGVVLGVACAVVAVRGLPVIGLALGAVLMGLVGMTLGREWSDGSTVWRVVGFILGAIVGYLIVRFSINFGIALVTAIGGGTLVWNGVVEAMPSTPAWLPGLAGLAVAVFGFAAQQATRRKQEAVVVVE